MDLTASTLAERLHQRRTTPPDEQTTAAAICHALTAGGAFPGGVSTPRRDIVRMHAPTIERLWGAPVVAGLQPRSLPAGRCRWCLADLAARVDKQPPPKVTPATRKLLGAMCTTCSRRRVANTAERVALTASASRRHSTFTALIASGTVVATDQKGRATRLRTLKARPTRLPNYSYNVRPTRPRDDEPCGCCLSKHSSGGVSFTFTPKQRLSYHDWVMSGAR